VDASAVALIARGWRRAAAALLALLLSSLALPAAHAGASRFCDESVRLTATQQDTLLRFGAVIREALEASGARVALIARSGLDLGSFGVRYSHAGLALRANPNAPWSVRQLYFACDEQRPRIFDQGLAAFVLGFDDADSGHVSVVFLPEAAARTLESVALDDARALSLLGARYSASAYPFDTRYQNCNQWVIEMLAAAWSGVAGGGDAPRVQAQAWLRDRGYAPTVFRVGSPLTYAAAAFVPWVTLDDHPARDVDDRLLRVTMPASIEQFVRGAAPAATRMEFCHDGRRVVARRGWRPIAEGCRAAEGDTVVALD
jgi:hypothetical protein